MKWSDIFLFLFLVILLAFSLAFFFLNLTASPVYPFQKPSPASYAFTGSSKPLSINTSQFYPNMRFPNKTISYSIDSACNLQKISEIEQAFGLIMNKTVLQFYPALGEGEITISCTSNPSNEPQEVVGNTQFFIAGEGGPTEIVNLSGKGYIIYKGKASLFRVERCNESKLALHEILHVLGFDHVNNSKSIMYPITQCDQTLDNEIVREINRLYTLSSLPDLSIEKASAVYSQGYISFNVTLTNTGFGDSSVATLSIYADNTLVDDYPFPSLKPGQLRMFEVSNLKVAKRPSSIIFVFLSKDGKDADPTNNQVAVPAR